MRLPDRVDIVPREGDETRNVPAYVAFLDNVTPRGLPGPVELGVTPRIKVILGPDAPFTGDEELRWRGVRYRMAESGGHVGRHSRGGRIHHVSVIVERSPA